MKDSNDFYARMSANELADYLEKWFTEPYVSDTVAMLRQQADQIAKLEKYEQQIKQMERAYDAHFKKAMGLND